MKFLVRKFHPSDLTALCRVCLLMGADGEDASALYRDADLLGLYFVAPYVEFEPELCFVLTGDGSPCGYVLGTSDSDRFARRCEQDWLPTLRTRYPLPDVSDKSLDAWVIRLIHTEGGLKKVPDRFAAHLHIDILSFGQAKGWGRALMTEFLERLRCAGVTGVHLRVGKSNTRAAGFYQRLGFSLLEQTEKTFVYARPL